MRLCYRLIQLFAYLMICTPCCCILTHKLEIWEHSGERGNSTTLNFTECANFPPEIASKGSSIDTNNMCVVLYSGWNCTGDSVEILPHSPSHQNLVRWGFDDKAQSAGPCRDPCDIRVTGALPTTPFHVMGFTEPDSKGSYIDILVDGCTQVPEAYQNMASIETNMVCVQLWANSTCTSKYKLGENPWDTIELRPYTPMHNDLLYWSFKKVVAISHCAWKCNGSRSMNETILELIPDIVSDNELLLFHKANYGGKRDKITLKEGCINLGMESEGKAMSVKTGSNVCVTLYDLRDCTGRTMDLIGSRESLQKTRFEKVVRSVKYCEKKQKVANLSVTEVSMIVGVLLTLMVIGFGISFHVLRRMKRAISLSEREIREFLEGVCDSASQGTLETTDGSYIGPDLCEGLTEINTDLQIAALSMAYNKNYEISRKSFTLETPLGAGQFGIVYRGILLSDPDLKKTVAVKTLKGYSAVGELRCLMKEVKVMLYIAELGAHPNIVEVVGCCTELLKTSGDLYMLMAYYCNGSLESHLRTTKTNLGKLETRKQLEWMADIAAGMEFLSASRIVHRDLSTRNILLDESYHAKICDFGLSRQLYQNSSYLRQGNDPLAWQWLPIEALLHSTFTTKSDVWSFGVVCWEIFTLGEEPFAGEKWSKDFIDKVTLGYRLAAPKECSERCYQLMLKCWQSKPSSRPEFSQISEEVHFMQTFKDDNLSAPRKMGQGYVESFVILV